MSSIDDKYWKDKGVNKIVSDLSPRVGETMRDLLNIYTRHYPQLEADLASAVIQDWVEQSLIIIIKEHAEYNSLQNRDQMSDVEKKQVVARIMRYLFNTGSSWIAQNT
jgi:hypothetical protein